MSSWITSEWASELRDLWNKYDPIGVFPVDENFVQNPLDEYDSYHGIVLKRLNENASPRVLTKDIKKIVTLQMGMTWNRQLKASTKQFVQNCYAWFETKKDEIQK